MLFCFQNRPPESVHQLYIHDTLIPRTYIQLSIYLRQELEIKYKFSYLHSSIDINIERRYVTGEWVQTK